MTTLTPVSFRKGRERAPRLSPVRVPGRHSARFWTEAEDAVIRQHYAAGGVDTCIAHLSRIGSSKLSRTSIYQRARNLGIASDRMSGKPRRRHTDLRTPEMDARIRAGWAQLRGRGAVQRFADELGIPRTELSRRALDLGLAIPHRKEPPWTAAEESLLPSLPLNDLHRSAEVMREHGFHRTPAAIAIRARRLSLSRRRSDVFSGTSAARLLGLDNKTVTAWCVDGTMPASRRGTARLPQQGGDTWTITPGDLRQWIIDNVDRIDIRKVDKHAFIDLLTSERPSDACAVQDAAVREGAPALPPSKHPPKLPAASRALPRAAKRPLAAILADCGSGAAE